MNGSLLVNTATYLCDEFNLGMTLHCESNEIIMCCINFGKLKNLPMLSVSISSYGCTREVWRARKMQL